MRKFKSLFGSGRLSLYSDYLFVIVVILGLIYELNSCRTENRSIPDFTPEQKVETSEAD